MSEATEQVEPATKSTTPKTKAAPKGVVVVLNHDGPTRKEGVHRYVGKSEDGSITAQVYRAGSKPPKTITITVS